MIRVTDMQRQWQRHSERDCDGETASVTQERHMLGPTRGRGEWHRDRETGSAILGEESLGRGSC